MNIIKNFLGDVFNTTAHEKMLKTHAAMEKEGWGFSYFYPDAPFAPPFITITAPDGQHLCNKGGTPELSRQYEDSYQRCAAALRL